MSRAAESRRAFDVLPLEDEQSESRHLLFGIGLVLLRRQDDLGNVEPLIARPDQETLTTVGRGRFVTLTLHAGEVCAVIARRTGVRRRRVKVAQRADQNQEPQDHLRYPIARTVSFARLITPQYALMIDREAECRPIIFERI